MIRWASEADQLDVERDLELYGNAYVVQGDDGKVRRIDPTTIEVQPEPRICPRCLQPYGRHGRADAHGPGFCINRGGSG